jgi:ABC-type sugar transport system substrate-binding protein
VKYVIKIKGYLDKTNVSWLDGMMTSFEADGKTIIFGEIKDQAALFGILKRLQDKGIYLISVNQEEN